MMWTVGKLDRTEQNPHIVDAAISPNRIELAFFIESPDRLDLFADSGGAELLDRLPDVLVPKENSRVVSSGQRMLDGYWLTPLRP